MRRRRFEKLSSVPSWRRMALHSWRAPRDPTIYGFLDLDVSEALRWIDGARTATGAHVTITHLVGVAAARAIGERPDVNSIVRKGRGLWKRADIDVFFMIARDDGEDLLGAKVERADQKDPVTVAHELERAAHQVRAHRAKELDRTGTILSALPDFLVRPAMGLTTLLMYELGLDLRRLGLPYDPFGSVMVTNIGVFGLDRALAPLVPFARAPIVMTVGEIRDAPVVVDGQLVVRPVLSIGASLDHRVLDGSQAGKLARRFRHVLEHPYAELGDPAALRPPAAAQRNRRSPDDTLA